MDAIDSISFGDVLKALRKKRGINQRELSTRLGVHANTISKWERGICLPDSKGMVLETAKELRLDQQETRKLLEASLTALSPHWHVPYQRNRFFTGREEILQQLHTILAPEQTATLAPAFALHGLSGMGKTQTAIEYLYRHHQEYSAILWVAAETHETVLSSFTAIAEVLDLPEKLAQEQGKIITGVIRWLNTHKGWLLIFDNVEHPDMLQPFLPSNRQGATLFTTRLQSLGSLASTVALPRLSEKEGLQLLLRRVAIPHHELETPELQAALALIRHVDGLPFALDQAGASLESARCSFQEYLSFLQSSPQNVLNQRGPSTDHPLPVVKTVLSPFERSEDLEAFPDTRPPSSLAGTETSAVAATPPSLSSLCEAQTPLNENIEATSVAIDAPLPQTLRSARAMQNRVRLRRRLRRAYCDLLEHSLQGAAWLELGLVRRQNAVQNATHLLLPTANWADQIIPPGTSLLSVYEEASEELLVLGEPGAGKSTLLLDLAQQLLQRAEEDIMQPLPLIVPLSSWAEKRLPLDVWLSEQVSQIYDIPRKLSERWVREHQFVPLLDGLDEMEETAQPACLAAINTYHREQLGPLVVSSRLTEYEFAARRQSLTLQSAVIVQPLSPEQIDDALMQAGFPLAVLRETFRENPALQEDATTPLLLHILLVTYQEAEGWEPPQKEDLLHQQIWIDYVQRMVGHKGDAKRYPLERTRLWLGWLAGQMRAHNQTVFYLENLQPDWLPVRAQRTYLWMAVRLPAIIIGMLISITIISLPSLSGFVQESVLGGFLGGLWGASLSRCHVSHAQRHTRLQRWGIRLATSAFIGLIFGFSFGFDSTHALLSDWGGDGLFFGAVIGLGSLLLQFLFALEPRHMRRRSKQIRHRWLRPTHFLLTALALRALLTAVLYGLIYGLIYGLGQGQNYVLGYQLNHGLIYGLDCGLNYGLNYGLVSVAVGLAVGLVARNIHLPERLKWTGESLKKSLFNARHLRITFFLIACFLLLGLSIGLIYGIFYSIVYGLISGLSIGLGYWFLFGVFQGIAHERIEDRDRRVPNQGIRRALSNSVSMSIIGGGMLGIIGFLGYGIAVGLNTALSAGLSSGLRAGLSTGPGMGVVIGASGGCLVWLLMGGVAVLRHLTIRCLLWRSRTFPWQAISFLDDATSRILLRRVGGGYSFTHRLLLDHLADGDATTLLASEEMQAKSIPVQMNDGHQGDQSSLDIH